MKSDRLESIGVDGHWMQTYTGMKFTPLAPNAADINIEDIAHALAHQCRYGGHCRTFYSVAQHSVVVAGLLPLELRLTGLLHDASEAYLQDMIRPLKLSPLGELYRDYEDRLMVQIARRFGIVYPFPREVKIADNIVLFVEKRDMVCVQHPWRGEEEYAAAVSKIAPLKALGPSESKHAFLSMFRALTATTDGPETAC